MSLEFTIDIIEQNKDRLFITGLSLTEIALTDTFTVLLQYGSSQKSKKQIASLELVVETIIMDGNPVDNISAQSTAMLILVGDGTLIEQQAHTLKWRKKNGRFIRTSDIALTLATS
ncbi:MAG: hypothetical protein WBC91_12230 [Phototrophicaceae bacterium]